MTGAIAREHGGKWTALAAATVCALTLAAGDARADPHQIKQGDITISSRVVRASIGHAPNSAAYMVIANGGTKPDALIAARCACAATVDIHKTEDMSGMSMMVSAAPVIVPPHGQVIFRPGGLHLMLTRLKEPLKDGGQQEITLVFQHAGAVRATFHVRSQIPAMGH